MADRKLWLSTSSLGSNGVVVVTKERRGFRLVERDGVLVIQAVEADGSLRTVMGVDVNLAPVVEDVSSMQLTEAR